MYTRYAVYFVPDGAWGDFGAAWLGWDARSGCEVDLLAPEHAGLTERPRKYGFHGTLRSPFRAGEECTEAQLGKIVESVSAGREPIELKSLQLSRIGPFFALTAPAEWAALQDLADRTLEAIDPCRAPLTSAELKRRRAGTLSERQEELLVRWGYPYVKEQFRFHLTLTGPAASPAQTETELRDRIAQPMETPLVVDSVSLLGEGEDGRFRQIDRFSF
jgi:hypothetical protein